MSRIDKKTSEVDCPSRSIYEKDLHEAVMKAINQVISEKDEFLPGMKLAIERTMDKNNDPEIAALDERLKKMQKELIQRANSRQNFDDLAEEINVLQEEKQRLQLEDADRLGLRQRMDALEEFLNEQQTELTEYDEDIVRRLLERITVYDDHLEFIFKSGIETEVKI